MRSELLAACITSRPETHYGVPQKAKRKFTSIWNRWHNNATYRQSQLVHNWLDVWVRYLDHIVHFGIYHNATQQQRERNMHILYSRSVDENRQAPPLSQRRGYPEAKEKIMNLQKEKREQRASFISVSERTQKNIISHPPHPAGHQTQHGGVRLHGLRAGKNGTITVGSETASN